MKKEFKYKFTEHNKKQNKHLVKKIILSFIFLYFLFALFCNIYIHKFLSRQVIPFNQGWYHYNSASLSSDANIYPDLIASLKPQATVFISMFLWPYAINEKTKNLPPFDTLLAGDLNNKNINGEVFIDGINVDYKIQPSQLKRNPIIQATSRLHWTVLNQPYALPNNLIMWIIHTPWLQLFINRYTPNFLSEAYAVLKISSNHQKIVIINEGQSAWIGSRNFNRINWNNQDQFLYFTGDIAKCIYLNAVKTIAYLNPGYENLYQDVKSHIQVKPSTIDTQHIPMNFAKLLQTAAIKPTILSLIRESNHIDGEISLFDEEDIIAAMNNMLKHKGTINLILDPNKYIFRFKTPFMPNIIAIKDLAPEAKVRIQNTAFQMHTKAALFTLKNGSICYFNSTANWTRGALVFFAFNDVGVLLCNDKNIISQFNTNFANNWEHSTPRENLQISYNYWRYIAARAMSLIGVNTW